MKYLHTMIRVTDIDAALDFFVNKLGMIETLPQGCAQRQIHADFPGR